MEQENDHKIQLNAIINDPDSLRHSDIPMLKELVVQYPYFQPLRLILNRLLMETEEAADSLTTTALYTNGLMLHQFLHRKPKAGSITAPVAEVQPMTEDIPVFEDKPFFEEATELEAASILEEVYASGEADREQPEEIDCVEEVNDSPVYEEISEINIHDYDPVEEEAGGAFEIYEEIAEVNSSDYVSKVEPLPLDVTGQSAATKEVPVIETLEDNFVENIAATDFFAFEENFSAEDKAKDSRTEAEAEMIPAAETLDPGVLAQGLQRFQEADSPGKDTNDLTNYDDDTLPYTFLWWLAKTRKEHSSIFQPYASPKKQAPNELQQQYVEHIFHIQSPFNAEEILNNVSEGEAEPKDAKIIDEFIKKDPQITPPRPEQIDTENKAKRSAEDHNDLVSETLAKIYIEQMLYHKAIDTYEKLSLKFPEKSRYFADLIQSIKKKI